MKIKKFEYYTCQDSLSDKALNKLGQKRWELVSHSVAVNMFGNGGQYYVFKRELEQK